MKILIISTQALEITTIKKHFKDEELSKVEIIQTQSIEDAENHLFETHFSCIVLDWELEGASEFIFSLKNDEMFRLLPILALVPDNSEEMISQVFLSGADNLVLKTASSYILALYLRPLLINNDLSDQLVKKVSDLQENSIRDFILLDLIKKYIPKTVWDTAQIFAQEQKITMPETELDLTIVFADIRGFTKMSQHLKPKHVIENLNAAFEIVTSNVYQYGGDVDKFIGDAFLGIFNEANAAIDAMIKTQQQIEQLNVEREKEELPRIEFRMGIHTGPVIRGHVGGHTRFDNTLIGDTVNTASRLEHASKPGDILISEATRKQAKLDIPNEYASTITLRGRDTEEKVYQIYQYLKK